MVRSTNQGWKLLFVPMLLAAALLSPGSSAQGNPAEDVFKSKCAACHGPDGGAKTTMGSMLKIRDLRSDEVQKQNDSELNQIITKGKNKMPAFDGKLKKEEIQQLVVFIRQLAKK